MPEELEDEFGDIIKKARMGMGYNWDELAHLTSIPSQNLQEMEKYRLKPIPEQTKALASVLGLNEAKLAAIATDSWHPEPRALGQLGKAVVEKIIVPYGAYSSNSYLLGSTETKEAAIIDPGGVVPQLLDVIRTHDLSIVYVLVTHGHGDHTGGLQEIARTFPNAFVVVSRAERLHGPDIKHPEDGEEFDLGGLTIKALATPGHTQGSMSFCVQAVPETSTPGMCFVGDTLFAGSVGGTSGSPEAFRQELESIRTKIFSLPEDTIILPGHGPVTAVGEEILHNPFF